MSIPLIASQGLQEIVMSRQGLKRGIKSQQINLRELNIIVDGTVATPVAAGYDRYGIKQIVDNGAGDYTIIFSRPFKRACQAKGLVMITPDTVGIITAVAFDRITVEIYDATDGTTAKDGAFYLCVIGSDHRFDY